jgi:hypothetical protein
MMSRLSHISEKHIVRCTLAMVVSTIVAGCPRSSWYGDPYAGCISGSQAIRGSKLQNCFEFQFDTYEGEFSELKRRPLFAIVWQAHMGGVSTSDNRNLIISIHGHSIAPSRTKKAVYALQPDYSLIQLPLTHEEIDHLFSIARSRDEAGPMFYSDPTWREKVQPNLKVVEPPQP